MFTSSKNADDEAAGAGGGTKHPTDADQFGKETGENEDRVGGSNGGRGAHELVDSIAGS